MAPKEFVHNIVSKSVWLNLLAMLAIVVIIVVTASLFLGVYTHHGESIRLPDVRKHSAETATELLEELGMQVEISDTDYVKSLPPGTVLGMTPEAGSFVKSGRIIYLTINAEHTPTIPLPDIIDNSSFREAKAKLMSMGFKVGAPQYVPGEQDWVYGVLINGHNVAAGERVSIEATLIIQVGNGQRDAADSVFMTDAPEEYYEEEMLPADDGGVDIEITGDPNQVLSTEPQTKQEAK